MEFNQRMPCPNAFWIYSKGYMLLGLISSLVFRAVRDALRDNPVAQEHIVGSTLTALAIADVSLYNLVPLHLSHAQIRGRLPSE